MSHQYVEEKIILVDCLFNPDEVLISDNKCARMRDLANLKPLTHLSQTLYTLSALFILLEMTEQSITDG